MRMYCFGGNVFVFFFKQKTAYEMRISDWSSDVCSSDLEEWGVTDGSRDEVLSYFEGIHPLPHQMLDRPTSWRRWATADRDPVEHWTVGRATLLGDAAHPMTQYLAQGACQALEDAVTLGAAIEAADGDYSVAFYLYEQARVPDRKRTRLN